MLKGISNHDVNSQSLAQQNEIEKIKLNKNNPYANVDKNLLIDETSISSEALDMYQRDLDIKRFSALAMSDPEDLSHNLLVAQNVFGAEDTSFENKIFEDIFNNQVFLKDLFS